MASYFLVVNKIRPGFDKISLAEKKPLVKLRSRIGSIIKWSREQMRNRPVHNLQVPVDGSKK